MDVLYIGKESQTEAALRAAAKKTRAFDLSIARSGDEGVKVARQHHVAFLQSKIGDSSGISVLETIRQSQNPIPIVISGSPSERMWEETVESLDSGADAYMVFPMHEAELVARIRAIVKRCRKREYESKIEFGGITLDRNVKKVTIGNQNVQKLTAMEYTLLAIILERRGEVVSLEEFYEHFHGSPTEPHSNGLQVVIGRLRRKLAEYANGHLYIESVYTVGYRLCIPSNSPAP